MKSLTSHLARQEIESRKRSGSAVITSLMSTLSEIQKSFIFDKSRLKVARCGRRAGKSYADAAYMIKVCVSKKNAKVLYLGITQESAYEIIWDVMVGLLHLYNIPHRPLLSSRVIQFPNGSRIKVFGADAKDAKNRLRGRHFDLVIVDECGYVAEVDELVDIVLPSMADYGGTLCLTSSPPEVMQGLFYEADQGNAKEFWKQYYWTMLDNPFFQGSASNEKFKNRAEEEMSFACNIKYGGNTNHPAYRREYWGEWVRDASNLIYPYDNDNFVYSSPSHPECVIGLDFGVATSSAMSCIKFNPATRKACVVKVWKEANILIDDFAVLLKRWIDDFNPNVVVADTGGLGKAFVQELVRRYNLPIRAADKQEKETGQRIVANDLLSKYVSVLIPDCEELVKEWNVLVREEKSGKEPRRSENHISDATLYAYRYIYNAVFQAETAVETEEDKMLRQLMERVNDEREQFDNF